MVKPLAGSSRLSYVVSMKRDPLVEILRTDFGRKKMRNKSYSLRSYSRDLGVDPSNLSKIINQQKSIGVRLRKTLAKKLGFEVNEIASWLMPAAQEKTSDKEYSQHGVEVFQIVSEWQHYAILELFKLKEFTFSFEEVAQWLGISLNEARKSIKRLQDAGLLKFGQELKEWLPSESSSSSILSIATSKAHREQQKQILEGGIDALKMVPIEKRSQSSMTMAIDTKKLTEAKQLIKTFRRDMGRLLASGKSLDEVYQLSISLYPVTKNRIKNKTKGELCE
ncbi:MAG: DUF4423 domain-containing protein [Oligoflexia bacterium]|nr:DUF4423 domain-containing protein [Oligoflexia bacterium]